MVIKRAVSRVDFGSGFLKSTSLRCIPLAFLNALFKIKLEYTRMLVGFKFDVCLGLTYSAYPQILTEKDRIPQRIVMKALVFKMVFPEVGFL